MSEDDPFAPLPEADAYRIYLYLSDYPDHDVMQTILRRDPDASVSFAKEWLHNRQPKPLIGDKLYDAWKVERFVKPGQFELLASGRAEQKCSTKADTDRSVRRSREDRSGSSEIRNGLRSLDPFASASGSRRQPRLANGNPKRRRKRASHLNPLEERLLQLRAMAELEQEEVRLNSPRGERKPFVISIPKLPTIDYPVASDRDSIHS